MTYPSVIVLEAQSFQRSLIVAALRQLGLSEILQASNSAQAMELLHQRESVDIALCDLSLQGLDCLEFLNFAGQLGLVRAVVLFSDLQPQLHRAFGQMAEFSGLNLLGVMNTPVQASVLQKMLLLYDQEGTQDSSPSELMCTLPGREEILRGLDLGEFRAYYQPKFVLINGDVAGAEVLARWQHPSRGLLMPKDFLAAVLAYDLIDEMFMQLLEQGLSLLSMLHRNGSALKFAFNLHASQLRASHLTEHIQQALKRYELPGSDLIFELAENGLLDCQSETQESLVKLRIMGCGLAIDDFGSGFSSLKLLCQLPFTQIKLDSEFVNSLQQPRSQAVITSTLALARSLNMELVIEGIGNAEDCQSLKEAGCELGQGFHFAQPMTAHQLISWLANRSENGVARLV
ncbi:EAL domain-containing response regulator [Pseudomonas mandelii]|uniref:EAL domain-containing response regulator n=1 Tax=Pseudomonas mandelii TaxID=75612 RepID=UPI003C73B012